MANQETGISTEGYRLLITGLLLGLLGNLWVGLFLRVFNPDILQSIVSLIIVTGVLYLIGRDIFRQIFPKGS